MSTTDFRLGQRVKDKVTGFTGILTARHEYLNGCIRYSVAPPVDATGKRIDSEAFDVQELELVDDGILQSAEVPERPELQDRPGGPQPGRVPHR